MKLNKCIHFLTGALLAISVSSCCSLCTKSVTATPTIENGKDTSKKSVAVSIEFEECKDRAVCEAMKALNDQMDQQTQWFNEGKITWQQYGEAKDKYYSQIDNLAKQGIVKGGEIPKMAAETGRSDKGKVFRVYREDFNSSKAFDLATAASIQDAAMALSQPAVLKSSAR